VTIAGAGGIDPIRLPALAPTASWAVRPPGTFAAELRPADALDAFGTIDLRGRWLTWDHPTAGRWSGVITQAHWSKGQGAVSLGARDFSFLLAKKRTAKEYDLTPAPSGSHVYRVVADASRVHALWLTELAIEALGAPVPLAARGQMVLDVLDGLARDGDAEWRVTPARVLEWRARLGVDRTADVALVEDRHIIDVDWTADLEAVTNDLLVIPSNADYQRTEAVAVEYAERIATLGTRMQDTLVVTDRISEAGLRPQAEAALRRLAYQGEVLTLILTDADGCFGWFAEGDTVTVLLPTINRRLAFRVMVRSIDVGTGRMTVTGDVVP
jgi:hypothetical protein